MSLLSLRHVLLLFLRTSRGVPVYFLPNLLFDSAEILVDDRWTASLLLSTLPRVFSSPACLDICTLSGSPLVLFSPSSLVPAPFQASLISAVTTCQALSNLALSPDPDAVTAFLSLILLLLISASFHFLAHFCSPPFRVSQFFPWLSLSLLFNFPLTSTPSPAFLILQNSSVAEPEFLLQLPFHVHPSLVRLSDPVSLQPSVPPRPLTPSSSLCALSFYNPSFAFYISSVFIYPRSSLSSPTVSQTALPSFSAPVQDAGLFSSSLNLLFQRL